MPMGKESRSRRCAEGLSLQEGAPAALPSSGCRYPQGEEKEKHVPRRNLTSKSQ